MLKHRWLSGVILLSLLSCFSTLNAQEAAEQPADVRILVDISGSMKETDPANLRIPAVNLLVELLPDASQAGIWTFGRYVNMLVPPAPVDDAWRANAKDKARLINSVGLYTNLTEALERARWKVAADSGYRHSLILLTDGRIDMREPGAAADTDAQQRQRLLNEVIPAYVQAGARIHTLALSDAADQKLLQQIALETGGLYLRADNADQLLKAFLKAFDRAVPAEQVPMQDNKFNIDASVREFTALIFRTAGARPTRLIAPDGQVLEAGSAGAQPQVRWYKDVNFDLITVTAPAAGEWQADADLDPDNRVQILSDLNLRVAGLPDTLFSGVPLDLAIDLTEKGQTITEPALLRLTDISLKVTAPDGRSGSKLLSDPENLPADGLFRESLSRLTAAGEYQFEVIASGRTFQRRQLLTAVLQEPLRVETERLTEQETLLVRVIPQNNVDTSLSRIIARITAPDTSSVITAMEYNAAAGEWQLRLAGDKGAGRYEVALNVRGITAGGADFRARPDDIQVNFPLSVSEIVRPDHALKPAPLAAEASASAAPEEIPAEAQPVPDAPVAPAPAAPAAAEPVAAEQPEPAPAVAEPAAETPPPVDLQARFAEQQQVAPAPVEEGLAWWVYALLAAGNLALFGGAAAWWLLRKRNTAAPADSPSAKTVPDDLIREELSDEDFAGDFDDFAGEAEEEIPLPAAADEAAADAETETAVPPASFADMGADTDISPDFADDFAIDPDPLDELDDWGEFDADVEAGKESDPEPRKTE